MAKTFFPKTDKVKRIKASAPHENAEYVVSVGVEMWGSTPHEVIKVQMAYDGKISGRRSPSYPLGTDDYKEVNKAIEELLSENKK